VLGSDGALGHAWVGAALAPGVAAGTFLRRVADRAGLDEDGAERATDAVLETLAERIAVELPRHVSCC
jgi:hypothetical protein